MKNARLFNATHAVLAAVLTTGFAGNALAAPIKVGVALDISGPFAAPGAEVRDGINLAVKQLGGKLGGVPAEFIMADMAGNPEQARQLVERLVQRDKIDFFTGPVASNVALAVAPSLFAAKIPYLSPNAGPSQLAGVQCNPYFFGTSYQNDTMHEAAGQYAANKGFKKVVIMAPNYPAGKDAMNGFKRLFKTPVMEEIYTKVGQLDFAAELAQIRSDKPEAIYIFQPGGMGINFIKQFMASGLSKDTVLISSPFTADEDIIPAVGEPMVGLYNMSTYAHDLDNPANKKFVAEFRKAYNNRYPSLYASFAYDVVMSMDAAVRELGGKLEDREALVKVLAKANFKSVRGDFKYGTNHYPTQHYYVRQIVKDAQGKVTNKLVGEKVLTAHHDSYVGQCQMK